MNNETRDIIETLNLILSKMATKDDVADLRREMNEGFASIRAEIQTLRLRLDTLEELMSNMSGVTKEIDYVMERQNAMMKRISAIEEHLGIKLSVAA